jgi:hypothetical protein
VIILTQKKYDEEDLLRRYKEACCAQGKVLNSSDINKSNKLPCYSTLRNYLGDIQNIIQKSGLKKLPNNTKPKNNLQKTLRTFCNDCIFDKYKCGKIPEKCIREAEDIYFESRGVSNFKGVI